MPLQPLWSFPVSTTSPISHPSSVSNTLYLGHHFSISHTLSQTHPPSSSQLSVLTLSCGLHILVCTHPCHLHNYPVCSTFSPIHSTMPLSHCLTLPNINILIASGSSSPLCFMQMRVGGSVKTQLL